MFFFFSKVLTIFLFPLNVAILLGIVYSLKLGKGRKKLYLLFPWLFLWFFSYFPIAQGLIQPLEDAYPYQTVEQTSQADAIVVLGGMVNNLTRIPNRTELTGAVDRLTDAISLYKAGKAKKILFTGGSGILFFEGVSEASQAYRLLIAMGIPEQDIILEDKSRNTRENASFTLGILKEQGAKSIILVTSAFHMKRSMQEFANKGVEVSAFPTDYRTLQDGLSNWDTYIPSVGALDTSTIAIKEWVGTFAYQAMEKLSQ
ncbi:MAG: YdcF family protein [Leptospiraceae bacterium]|nr:YdcF family protein [Leptospiraceae bacterium]MCZ8345782.1 YdcF family protein [Leptospiraceae bacterium]